MRPLPFILLLSLFALPIGPAAAMPASQAASAVALSSESTQSGRYVIIHMDGISSHHLLRELREGHLPNIEALFWPDGIIPGAITYLPSKTPMVISGLRDRLPIEEAELVSWAGVNRETGEKFSGPGTFTRMLRSKSRLSAASLVHGAPVFYGLNTLSLDNLPDLLGEYRILQFHWYPIDTFGHFYGEERYLQRLHMFDREIGKLADRLDERVNLILYSDHGMAFGEGVETDLELQDLLGEKLLASSYPNLYLEHPEEAPVLAERVVRETGIDFAFYRKDDRTVIGIHDEGRILIRSENGRFQYLTEGVDPFGYLTAGYDGSPLSTAEWVELTWELPYPAAPSLLYRLLSNPASGDIVTLLGHGKFSRTGYSSEGNHGGFTDHELSIPILFRGPDTDVLHGLTSIELHELFPLLDGVDLNYRPARSRHQLEAWHRPGTNEQTLLLSLSPFYRWAVGAEWVLQELKEPELFSGWVQFDLFRSYLAQVWIGTGFDLNREGELQPVAFLRHELRYRWLTARSTLNTNGRHRFAIDFRVAGPASVQIVNFNSAGIRLEF